MIERTHMLKLWEAALIALLLTTAAAAVLLPKRTDENGKTAVIVCGDVTEKLPLDEDGSFRFDGINAEFVVRDGKIAVRDVGCPDRICEKTGFIGASGQAIICVPNRLTVTVTASDDGFDAAVG